MLNEQITVPVYEELMHSPIQGIGATLLRLLGKTPHDVRVSKSISIEVHTVEELLSGTAQVVNIGCPLSARVSFNPYENHLTISWTEKVSNGN